jgi:hypothetical protein
MMEGAVMRIVLTAVFLAFLIPAAAEAQQKRDDMWCRDQVITGAGSSVMICSAYTYQQCMASRTGPGERCYLNPRYDPLFRRN